LDGFPEDGQIFGLLEVYRHLHVLVRDAPADELPGVRREARRMAAGIATQFTFRGVVRPVNVHSAEAEFHLPTLQAVDAYGALFVGSGNEGNLDARGVGLFG